MSDIKITILGMGRFGSDSGYANQSMLIEYKGSGILIDCGPTAVYQMRRYDIDYDRIDYILLTHYHGDHTGSIPILLTDMKVNPDRKSRKKDIHIVGKSEVKANITTLIDAMKLNPDLGFVKYYDAVDTDLNTIMPDGVSIKYYNMIHREESIAYRLDFDNGKSVSVTGDTRWTDEILKLADGCDLMFIENSMKDYYDAPHLSLEELLKKSKEINCEKIKIVHTISEVVKSLNEKEHTKVEACEDGEVINL